jgi:hypothetical protein
MTFKIFIKQIFIMILFLVYALDHLFTNFNFSSDYENHKCI